MRFATLRCIFILLFSHSWLVLADRNVTIDNLDASIILSPFRDWGWSKEGHGTNRGSFAFSNTENATATITFTRIENATAIYWQGFKRSGPALYSVCIDCTSPSQAQIVSGHDDNSQSTDSVVILFSNNYLKNSRHTITITNLVDPRFGFPSQITLDAFILTVLDDSSSPPSTSTTDAATQMPAAMSMPSGPSSTMVAYWAKTPPEAGLSTGAIVGIAFAGAIALFGLIGLGWWLLKGRKRDTYGKVSHAAFGGQHDEKRGLTARAESPMSRTLHLPPRNAEQASMFGSTLTTVGHSLHKAPSSYPLTHHDPPRAPSIRSALSSLLSRTPSTRSASSHSEWGTIHVALSNPFTSPRDAETESEWDFDTPLPSSTLGSTFTRTPEDIDVERTPTLSRGWRRVEDVHNGYSRGPPPHDWDPSVNQPHRPGKGAWEQRTPLPLI